MGYKIDSYIERQFYDEYGGMEAWMEKIHISGNGVSDTVCLKQGDDTISLTVEQARELGEILKRVY